MTWFSDGKDDRVVSGEYKHSVWPVEIRLELTRRVTDGRCQRRTRSNRLDWALNRNHHGCSRVSVVCPTRSHWPRIWRYWRRSWWRTFVSVIVSSRPDHRIASHRECPWKSDRSTCRSSSMNPSSSTDACDRYWRCVSGVGSIAEGSVSNIEHVEWYRFDVDRIHGQRHCWTYLWADLEERSEYANRNPTDNRRRDCSSHTTCHPSVLVRADRTTRWGFVTSFADERHCPTCTYRRNRSPNRARRSMEKTIGGRSSERGRGRAEENTSRTVCSRCCIDIRYCRSVVEHMECASVVEQYEHWPRQWRDSFSCGLRTDEIFLLAQLTFRSLPRNAQRENDDSRTITYRRSYQIENVHFLVTIVEFIVIWRSE